MDKPLITSLSNPLVKLARALHHKKARHATGAFLVEGIHHVGEAIEAGWEVESLLYAPELLTSIYARDLIARLGSKPQPVSASVMESLAVRLGQRFSFCWMEVWISIIPP
jgi:TrmH family RNA methyltransferase